MAELPIWSFSKGSSTSFKLANKRTAKSKSCFVSSSPSGVYNPPSLLTIRADLVNGGSETSQRSQNIGIDLPRVGLSGDRVGVRQTRQLGDPLIERFDLVMVPIKELQEAPLSPRGPLDSSEPDIVPRSLEVPQVPKKLLDPEGSPLSDGGQLGGLEVGESEGGEVSVGLGELGETRDDGGQLGEEDVESVSEEDQVGVAGEQDEAKVVERSDRRYRWAM